jgi:CheY-like chemotaxis protein
MSLEGIGLMSGYVLVVDDDPDVRRLVSDVLDVMGVERREAANGQQALDLVQENTPTLIILDLMMPVMDGFTMIARLHGNPVSRKIPVILLSAIADNEPHMRRLPGVVGVLRKGSFSLRDLSAMVTQILNLEGVTLGRTATGSPVASPEQEEVAAGTPVESAEGEKADTDSPVEGPEEEKVAAGTPVVGPEEEKADTGSPVESPKQE